VPDHSDRVAGSAIPWIARAVVIVVPLLQLPVMSRSRSDGRPRPTRQPWFGLAVAIVAVVVIVGGCFALKSVGDSRTDSAGSDERSASADDPRLAVRMTLTNSASMTVFVNAINVVRADWYERAPDENRTDALNGRWIDPGETVAVVFGLASTERQSNWDLSTLPVARSSSGGVITFYPQTNTPVTPDSKSVVDHDSWWYWPTSARPTSVSTSGCSPTWSGPVGGFTDASGRTGTLTATVTCTGQTELGGPLYTTTNITFTDSRP